MERAGEGKEGREGEEGEGEHGARESGLKMVKAGTVAADEERQDLRGHRQMRVWQNADQLDALVQTILKKIPKHEWKMRSQIDNASDSIGANFVEGYYSGALGEYIRFAKYAKRSLAELEERVRRVLRNGYVGQNEYAEFDDLATKTMYLFDRLVRALEKKREQNGMARRPRKPTGEVERV